MLVVPYHCMFRQRSCYGCSRSRCWACYAIISLGLSVACKEMGAAHGSTAQYSSYYATETAGASMAARATMTTGAAVASRLLIPMTLLSSSEK